MSAFLFRILVRFSVIVPSALVLVVVDVVMILHFSVVLVVFRCYVSLQLHLSVTVIACLCYGHVY